MVEELRRSLATDLVIFSGNDELVPEDLSALWAEGFRARVTFVSPHPDAAEQAEAWLKSTDGVISANLLALDAETFARQVFEAYTATYPDNRRIVRMRDRAGELHQVDLTSIDDPERPLLDSYSLIEERDLKSLLPEELSEQDFIGFFRNPDMSWRPHAAGLPWMRDDVAKACLTRELHRLDTDGPEANCIAYVASEPGAGGTTLARALAWECATRGYPVLIAKSVPFTPDALPVMNFMHRALAQTHATPSEEGRGLKDDSEQHGLYEVPWLVVFDTVHWQYREDELRAFKNALQRAGRTVCILVVTGTQLGLDFLRPEFKKVAELNHSISLSDALSLGLHLNRFMKMFGRDRTEDQWISFYNEHTVQYLEGMAAFWVTLSFWIQGQYDLSESIQEWMYRCFKEKTKDDATIRNALVEIAALTSERHTLPESLLPPSTGPWPLGQLLDDARADLAPLGLVRIMKDGERWWGLVHDILGRLLINAVFFDYEMRESLGLAEARDPEYLRFLILRRVAQKRMVGERRYRAFGEDFATAIFKIDPDHGRASFAAYWREALAALDGMPKSLRDTSRLFRHHTAVTRRRVAAMNEEFYGVTEQDRELLLLQAIDDINYALNYIDESDGSESSLNLYNTLANAYFDRAQLEINRGGATERVAQLRQLANEATRRAFQENSTNSYVVETYVKNLLQNADVSPADAILNCVEALGILFSVLATANSALRAVELQRHAERAVRILLRQVPTSRAESVPQNALDVLVQAWLTLSAGGWSGGAPDELSPDVRKAALEHLAHPAGRGNLQVIRLTYELLCADAPRDFNAQLRLLEQLHASLPRLDPQLRLEYAILLFQNNRAPEGDKIFAALRRIWRETEHFVFIPERLRWLWSADGKTPQTVHAVVGSEYSNRTMARVAEFGNASVPFRLEEFAFHSARPGTRFASHVVFGHNGPFLRPVTAQPKSAS